jgi:[acyl-carrier-protein] S-malonyltransferase
MTKVAFVFPGQGAQQVGMGQDAFVQSAAARSAFEQADRALGESLSRLCFEGPAETLQMTANTQPAVLTTSIALFRALGARCDMAAGHSLGEYSAHVAAETIDFEEAVKVVRQRGQYMQEAVPVGLGAMAAVLGAKGDAVEKVCAEVGGVVEPVNYNAPGQVVIAGQADAVAQVVERMREQGAKIRSLPVSAPFHCQLMAPAEQRLKPHLEALVFRDPAVPVYANVDAQPVFTGDSARSALIRQVSRPVRWQQIIERMIADGAGVFIEIGPGAVLSGLIGRIDKKVKRVTVESPDDFPAALEAIQQARLDNPALSPAAPT